MASTNYINECKTPANEDRLGKIVIDNVEYNQGNNLSELELENSIYNNGTIIGNTYTKSLKASLINVDKDTEFVGKKAVPSIGVKYDNNTTEYIDFDEYTIESLNDEQTKNYTEFTGYDALNILDNVYVYRLEDTEEDTSHTVGEYFQDLLRNLGLETETSEFTNSDIVIPKNPFVNNETNRTVLSEIEKVSCNFSRIYKRTRTVEGQTETYYVLNLEWVNYGEETTVEPNTAFELNDVVKIKGLNELEGNTHQFTTTGKNILNPFVTKSAGYSTTIRGVKFTINSNGSITIDGTNDGTGNSDFYVYGGWGSTNVKLSIDSNSVFSSSCSTTNGNINLYLINDTTVIGRLQNTTSNVSITANNNITAYMIRALTGTTINNITIYPMLEKGSVATNFEPYTNGASPNPDYPQSIEVVSGRQDIVAEGKNIYDINFRRSNGTIMCSNGTATEVNGVFTLTSTGADMRIWAVVNQGDKYNENAGKLYEFTADNYAVTITNDLFVKNFITFYDENKVSLGFVQKFSNKFNFSKNDKEGAKYFSIRIGYGSATIGESYELLIQLEKGSTQSKYEPYVNIVNEINLGKNLVNFANLETNTYTTYIWENDILEVESTTGGYKRAYIDITNLYKNNSGKTLRFDYESLDFSQGANPCVQLQVVQNGNSSYINLVDSDGTISNKTIPNDTSEITQVLLRIVCNNTNTSQASQISITKPILFFGNTSTTYSPYKTPIELCKIGDYQDMIFRGSGVNLFDKDNTNSINAYINGNTMKFTSSGTVKTYYITCKPNTTYTIQKILSNQFRVGTSSDIPVIGGSILQFWQDNSATQHTITTDANAKYLCICIYNSSGATITEEEVLNSVMLNKGTTALPYEPYNSKGKWYLHKEIGKVVLDGSENYSLQSVKTNTTAFALMEKIGIKAFNVDNVNAYTSYFTGNSNGYNIDEQCFWINGNGYLRLRINNTIASTINDFKTWLSTHNTIVYYILATPTYTEITDEELIQQLNDVELLYRKNNITVVSGDLSSPISFTYFNDTPDYEFTTSDYSTLEGSLTEYGPINCVLLGNEDIGGENVYKQDDTSIAINGENKLLIDAEYFLFNQNLRQSALDKIYKKMNGFRYYDLSLTTLYGKPFLDIGNKIRVNTNEGKVYDTYILQHTFTYNGAFKSIINSPALTKQEEIVKSTESVSDKIKRTEIMVDKANGTITSLTTQTQNIQDNLRENYYTLEQTNQLIQTAQTGITNTFSEAGGNNIFRNTGLWFEATSSEQSLFPSSNLYPSSETFTGNVVNYEFWNGKVNKIKEDKASNMIAMSLVANDLYQEQVVPNGNYTISFKYKKLIQLANVSVKINDVSYNLTEMQETEFLQTIQVNSQHILILFSSDTEDSCEIYDLMVNAGTVKLSYSQNQNETTTDTVNISKGITITSSDLDVTFKANADGIRTLDKNGTELTKFTDTGMTTKKAIIEEKSQIVGTLWQEVGDQTWITKL